MTSHVRNILEANLIRDRSVGAVWFEILCDGFRSTGMPVDCDSVCNSEVE